MSGEFGDVGGCEERRDLHGEREGRIAAIFFPTILLRDRAVAQNIAGGVAHHGPPALQFAQTVRGFAAQQIQQQDGEGGFVHLNTGPIGAAIEPEILRPVAVSLLR